MLKAIYLALNLREDEQDRGLLLLGYGFFMGVLLATFQLTSETQLVTIAGTTGDSAIVVSYGLFTAAVLGVISALLFTFFQSRISFGMLATANLLVIFGVVTGFYLLHNFLSDEYLPYLAFIQFAFMGPITVVSLLAFWGIFGRLFDLRQSKRIIGGIDTGQLVAAIVTFFIVGTGIVMAETYNLLLVSSLSVLGSMYFLVVIRNRYKLGDVQAGYEQSRNVKVKEMLQSRYVVLLAVFISLSVFAYLLVENSYLASLSLQYPADEERSLRQFLGWFNGSILMLSFIFQTFFNDRIIAEYGLKVSLMILPLILSVFSVVIIVLALVYDIGGGQTDVNVLYLFFIFVALSKLFITFLRDALENPTFKLYFMTLDTKIRFDIQAKIEGVVVELAKVVGGAIIIGLGLLPFFEIDHYYYILVFVIAGWIYAASRLYAEYRQRIKSKLENKEIVEDELDIVQNAIIKNIENNLSNERPSTVLFCYKLLEKINPVYSAPSINVLMHHKNEQVREFAQYAMNAMRGVSVSDMYIIYAENEEARQGRIMLSKHEVQELFEHGEISKRRVAALCRSETARDRQYGAELIGHHTEEETLFYLSDLLRDIDDNVRKAAIYTAQKRHNYEVISALIVNLKSPRFSNLAKSALFVIGQEALPVLDNAFYKSGQDSVVMQRIVQIMGRIGGPTAIDMLWNKIDFPDKVIHSQVLESLSESGFRAGISQISRIKFAIENNIQDIAWNLAAYLELPDSKKMQQLRQALKEENDHDIRHIYTLLSMLYDPESIHLIKQNLESGTSEGITYAIEMLDVLLTDDLKQRIIPVLDDIPAHEKVRRLQAFFPRSKYTTEMTLKFLINRDFTQSNRWTKACALYQIGRLKVSEFQLDLIANLFNSDRLIREMAAWSMYQISPDLYKEHRLRLAKEVAEELDNEILHNQKPFGEGALLYEKITFLKSMKAFDTVTGLLLSYLADDLEVRHLPEGESLSLHGEMINYFVIVRTGRTNLYQQGELTRELTSGKFVGELLGVHSGELNNILVALEDTELFLLNKDRYYEILADNLLFAQSVIKHMTA